MPADQGVRVSAPLPASTSPRLEESASQDPGTEASSDREVSGSEE